MKKTDTIDTIDALIARFVAGRLPLPARVLVESHLEISGQNRKFLRGLDELAGAALEDVQSSGLSDRERMLDTVFTSSDEHAARSGAAQAGVFPRALRDFAGFDVENVPWRTRLPGIRQYEIGDVDGCEANLFWFRPGRRLPAHTHEGSELSLVLDGAFSDQRGRFARGDISVADNSLDHRPVADKDRPCIAFIITDAPLKLTGPLHQRLSDILGA